MLATLDRQARAHGLDPADERVRGTFRNVLSIVLLDQGLLEQELQALRTFRETLQRAVGEGTETAVVYQELANLERFYGAP
jgi:hypothetical protein